MDEEIKQNLLKLEAIKQKLFKAFDGVTLGDCIGFWEADSIDGYLTPDTDDYKKAKANDERYDFRKVYDELSKYENGYRDFASSFMDAKGLHFYFPVMLLVDQSDTIERVLRNLVAMNEPKYVALMQLLTIDQKKAIIEYFEYVVDYDDWIKFYLNFKGHKCHKCGKIHEPENYTTEQAKLKVESGSEYIFLQYLKGNFNL